MGIAERKERQKKELRDNILRVAWQVVNEEGWQSLSIRKIAEAIEYSVPVVYDHFENKEAILSEFSRQGFRLLSEKLQQAKQTRRKPARQLEALAYAYWDFAFEHKAYYQLMFGLGMPGCESVRKVPELMAFIEVISTTIEPMVQAESPTQVVLKVHSFWSMIHGLVSINLLAPARTLGGLSPEELNRLVLRDFITGFIGHLEN
jgi:AcrR family transcriptional regulator